MTQPRLITYHEIAAHWQVSVRSVRRWVKFLEALGIITPRRPTMNTVRLTVADYATLESHKSRMQCRPSPPSKVRVKSASKRTGSAGTAKKPSGEKTSKTVLDRVP